MFTIRKSIFSFNMISKIMQAFWHLLDEEASWSSNLCHMGTSVIKDNWSVLGMVFILLQFRENVIYQTLGLSTQIKQFSWLEYAVKDYPSHYGWQSIKLWKCVSDNRAGYPRCPVLLPDTKSKINVSAQINMNLSWLSSEITCFVVQVFSCHLNSFLYF